MTIVGTTVFPTLSDTLGLGTGAALTPGGVRYLMPAKTAIPPPAVVFVRFRPGVGPQAGRQALAARLAQLGSFTVDGPAAPTDLLNFGQVQDLPQVLGTGLAAVALLTITHLLMTSVRRRQRDFAILRALGFTSWQVRAHALLAGTHAGRDGPADRCPGRDRVRQAVLAGLRAPARHHPGGSRAACGAAHHGGRWLAAAAVIAALSVRRPRGTSRPGAAPRVARPPAMTTPRDRSQRPSVWATAWTCSARRPAAFWRPAAPAARPCHGAGPATTRTSRAARSTPAAGSCWAAPRTPWTCAAHKPRPSPPTSSQPVKIRVLSPTSCGR